jgi:hypothetical protein
LGGDTVTRNASHARSTPPPSFKLHLYNALFVLSVFIYFRAPCAHPTLCWYIPIVIETSISKFNQARAQFPVATTKMPQGKAIPSVVHWIVVRLGTTMSEEDIAMYTDISIRSVRKILSTFRLTGCVIAPKSERPKTHRSLNNYDVEVRVSLPNACLFSQTCYLVHVSAIERESRPLPRRTSNGTSRDMRYLSLHIHNLENPREGGLFNEKGESYLSSRN